MAATMVNSHLYGLLQLYGLAFSPGNLVGGRSSGGYACQIQPNRVPAVRLSRNSPIDNVRILLGSFPRIR
jgi:hypothetical protein